jgi:TPR repeat protein
MWQIHYFFSLDFLTILYYINEIFLYRRVLMLKTQVSLFVLVSILVSFAQPAWSMEEEESNMCGVGTPNSQTAILEEAVQDVSPPPTKKRRIDDDEEEEGETSESIALHNLMKLPEELLVHILFYTYTSPGSQSKEAFLNSQLVSRRFQELGKDTHLINAWLEKFVWGYFLEKQDLNPAKKYERNLALFKVCNQFFALPRGDITRHKLLLDALEEDPVSNSRLLIYELMNQIFGDPSSPHTKYWWTPFRDNPWQMVAKRSLPALLSFREDFEKKRFNEVQGIAIKKFTFSFELLKQRSKSFDTAILSLEKTPEAIAQLQTLYQAAFTLNEMIVNNPEEAVKTIPYPVLQLVAYHGLWLNPSVKLDILKPLAEQGDVEAQYTVASIYDSGPDCKLFENRNKALYWYELAAVGGHRESQGRLASIYWTEDAYKDLSKAIRWYTEALKHEFKRDLAFDLACCYRERNSCHEDKIQAFIHFQKAAAEENMETPRPQIIAPNGNIETLSAIGPTPHYIVEGQYLMGYCYEKGEGVLRDPKKALECFEKAAQANNKSAQYKLHRLYEKGEGFPHDPEKSAEFLKAAAKNRHLKAIYKLGLRFLMGDPYIPQDTKKAIKYITRASDDDHKAARAFVEGLVKKNRHAFDDKENEENKEEEEEEEEK